MKAPCAISLLVLTGSIFANSQLLYLPDQLTMATSNDIPPGPPLLVDVISLDKSIHIFSGLTRSVESISKRVGDASRNTTILAPTNVAISKLPRKPWEDPDDEGGGGDVLSEIYKGLGGEDRAKKNIKRFVEAHCIGTNPWEEGVKTETLGGRTIWWGFEDGVKKVCF